MGTRYSKGDRVITTEDSIYNQVPGTVKKIYDKNSSSPDYYVEFDGVGGQVVKASDVRKLEKSDKKPNMPKNIGQWDKITKKSRSQFVVGYGYKHNNGDISTLKVFPAITSEKYYIQVQRHTPSGKTTRGGKFEGTQLSRSGSSSMATKAKKVNDIESKRYSSEAQALRKAKDWMSSHKKGLMPKEKSF